MNKLYIRDKSDDDLIDQFIKSGLQDSTYKNELATGCSNKRAQRLWEAVLYDYLKFSFGADNLSSNEFGPDFKVNVNGTVIWVEAVCPVMDGVQCKEFDDCEFAAGNIAPETLDSQVLYWTNGLREKGIKKYNKVYKNIIKDDPFVIAISDMTASNLFSFNGPDSTPYFLKAVSPMGHKYVTNNGIETEVRHTIKNHNGSDIDVGLFLRQEYQPVSAVLAFDKAYSYMHIVHNPMAVVPIAGDIFPVHYKYA